MMAEKKNSDSNNAKRGGYNGSAPKEPIKVPSTPGASTNPKPQESGTNADFDNKGN
jgi:hypothetical protein